MQQQDNSIEAVSECEKVQYARHVFAYLDI